MNQWGEFKLTPEVVAQLVEMLPTARSLREIAVTMGLSQKTVLSVAKPVLAIMKLQGTQPKCECGKDRFHRYGCTASYAKASYDRVVPGRSVEKAGELLKRRALIVAMLADGCRYIDISEAFGISRTCPRKYLRFLTPDQLKARQRIIEAGEQVPSRRWPSADSAQANQQPKEARHAQ